MRTIAKQITFPSNPILYGSR